MKELLESKKFWATIVCFGISLISLASGHPFEVTIQMISPFLAYIIGQGIADTGKTAAKIEAATNKGEQENE